jgi:hypothetical protein
MGSNPMWSITKEDIFATRSWCDPQTGPSRPEAAAPMVATLRFCHAQRVEHTVPTTDIQKAALLGLMGLQPEGMRSCRNLRAGRRTPHCVAMAFNCAETDRSQNLPI